jgi:hypothetical protein
MNSTSQPTTAWPARAWPIVRRPMTGRPARVSVFCKKAPALSTNSTTTKRPIPATYTYARKPPDYLIFATSRSLVPPRSSARHRSALRSRADQPRPTQAHLVDRPTSVTLTPTLSGDAEQPDATKWAATVRSCSQRRCRCSSALGRLRD